MTTTVPSLHPSSEEVLRRSGESLPEEQLRPADQGVEKGAAAQNSDTWSGELLFKFS